MAQVYVKVEVDLDEFDDADLIYEIESRGWLVREKGKECRRRDGKSWI